MGKKEFQLLKDGNWESHSANMLVEKRDGTEKISGPGFIRQVKQNYFQITIFNLKVKGGDKENILQQFSGYKFKAGEIISLSESYDLTTKDSWKSNWLSEPDIHYTDHGTIYTYYTREIFAEIKRTAPQSKASITFRAFHEYKGYPSNNALRYGTFIKDEGEPGTHLCVADVKVWNYNLRFFVHDGESVLSLKSSRHKKRHNDSIEYRAIEALGFVLGEPFEWNVKTISDSKGSRQHICLIPNRLSPRTKKPYEDRWVPKSKESAMFWELYSKYLRYILKDKISYYSEFGSIFQNLACLRASEQELSAYALNLCVAIEDLLAHHFCKRVNDAKRTRLIGELLGKVDIFLTNKRVDQTLSNIIKSHVSRLKPSKESTKRTLLRLADESKILKRRVKSWESVRNKVAHGKRILPTQDMFNKIGDLETLLFQIVFQMINYKGKHTDYGEIGYPRKSYPSEL